MFSKKLSAADLATRLDTRTTRPSSRSKQLFLGAILSGAMLFQAAPALADGFATFGDNSVTSNSTEAQAYGFGQGYGQAAIANGLTYGQVENDTMNNLSGIIGEANAAAVAAGICDAFGAVGQGPCANAGVEMASVDEEDEDAADEGDSDGGDGGGSCGCSSCGCG